MSEVKVEQSTKFTITMDTSKKLDSEEIYLLGETLTRGLQILLDPLLATEFKAISQFKLDIESNDIEEEREAE